MKRARVCSLGILLAILFCLATPIFSLGADKLIVRDEEGATTFTVEDTGLVSTASSYTAQGQYPGFWLDEKWMQFQRRGQSFGAYEASPVFINIDAPQSAFVVTATGNVGFGQWGPSYPLHMASGAHCTAGGVWTNASSREYKTDIKQLTAEKAMVALAELKPVEFAYKADSQEKHVGFIAEDVPELVATKDRKGMSSMDVVAVLTKVVQEQRATIAELSRRLAVVERAVKRSIDVRSRTG